jgi:Flp pilus assembly protein TadG
MRLRTRTRAHSRAQGMVEFALVISMFTLVMLALFDWSRVFGTYLSLSNATRESARRAQVVTNTHNPMFTTDAQPIVNQTMLSYTLPLGPGKFPTPLVPADVCLFNSGTVLSPTTTDPCNPLDNGGNTPVLSAASGTGAILAVHATYTVYFLPMMSALLPNGVTFSASTVTTLE